MKKLVIMVIGVGFLLVSNVHAEYRNGYDQGSYDDRFHQRQKRQHRRIEQGIRNGDLTHREIEKLRCEQDEIASLEHRFLRDGWFSDWERRKLQRRLKKASNRIYRYKHNHRVNRRYYRDDYGHNERHGYDRTSGMLASGENSGFYFSW